jgi:hypothetical protein
MSTWTASTSPAFSNCWMVSAPWTPTDFPGGSLGLVHRAFDAVGHELDSRWAAAKNAKRKRQKAAAAEFLSARSAQ